MNQAGSVNYVPTFMPEASSKFYHTLHYQGNISKYPFAKKEKQVSPLNVWYFFFTDYQCR